LKIILDESPSLLNEISSDLRKELPDIDIIKNMLFPNKINVYLNLIQIYYAKYPEA
jgi:hypothetical protein